MTATAFLFDLDGTLADTLPDIASTTNHVRARFDLPPVDDDTVRSFIGDGARALLLRALRDVLPDPGAARDRRLDEAYALYTEHHDGQCTQRTTLFAGARDHVERLRRDGCALAIVTNKPERFAIPVARHLGLDDCFPVVVGGDTVAPKKPDPAPLRFALQQLGAEGARVTMVGDGLQDVRAGKAFGARTIACLFGYADPDALRTEGADEYWRAFGVAT